MERLVIDDDDVIALEPIRPIIDLLAVEVLRTELAAGREGVGMGARDCVVADMVGSSTVVVLGSTPGTSPFP